MYRGNSEQSECSKEETVTRYDLEGRLFYDIKFWKFMSFYCCLMIYTFSQVWCCHRVRKAKRADIFSVRR